MILSPLSMKGLLSGGDGKAWYPDEYRQPEPGNQSRQPPDEVHPAAYPKPQRLDYRAGRKKRKELLAQKRRRRKRHFFPNLLMKYMEIRKEERKDWTRAGQNRGTSQDLKAVSEALSYLRQKGAFHCGGLRSISGIVWEISRRLPQSDEAKGSPKQSD